MLTNLDIKTFYFINKSCANRFLDFLMPIINELGSGEFLIVLSLVLIVLSVIKKKSVSFRNAGVLLLAGLTITYYVVYFLKTGFARPRPFIALPDVRLFVSEKGFSFPSGHATQVFMSAVILSKFFKKYILFFVLAFLVCLARVYLGAHFPVDVASGAVIGLIIGYILISI